MRIGITGHQYLSSDAEWEWVETQLRAALSNRTSPLVALSCLAVGADQLFASLALSLGGKLVAVIPFREYEETFGGDDVARYRELLGRAAKKVVLGHPEPTREHSYFAAGKRVVDDSDLMVAVWNGLPAQGLGGTRDVVCYALDRGKRVIHINPVKRTVRERISVTEPM